MLRWRTLGMAPVRRALCVLAMVLAGAPAWADPPEGYPFVDYDEGLERAQAQDKMVFLYFGRYGCGYCEKTNKETFSDPSLKALYTDHYVLVYVDAESGERLTLPTGERITEMELGARLGVVATPVFVYLEPSGKPVFQAPGFKTVADFKAFDRYVQGGHYKSQSINEFLKEES